MIKKILLLLISIILTVAIFAPKVGSQAPAETEFDKTYKEYLLKVEDYNKAHEDYILARSTFLRFKTLQAKTDAMVATLKMLEARDDVFLSYLAALKEKLKETKGVEDERRNALNLKIDEETSWLADHKSRLSSAGSLEDLVADSEEVKLRHKTQTESLFYEILITVSCGKETNFQGRTKDLLSSIKEVFDQIKAEEKFSTAKLQLIDRWIFDSEGRIERAEGKRLETDKTITTVLSKQGSFVGVYDGIMATLKESHQYLKESSSFLKEVIREIKTAE